MLASSPIVPIVVGELGDDDAALGLLAASLPPLRDRPCSLLINRACRIRPLVEASDCKRKATDEIGCVEDEGSVYMSVFGLRSRGPAISRDKSLRIEGIQVPW